MPNIGGNFNNLRIGAVAAWFGFDNGDRTPLGHSRDGAEFEFEREFEDLVVDKHGNMPVDAVLTGNNLTVKLFLAEPNITSLAVAIPEGDHQEGVSGERLGLGTDAGFSLRDNAEELLLRPLKNVAAEDDSEDILIYKAASIETVPLNYKIDEQRIVEVTFRAFVDDSYVSGRRLGQVGPTDIS